MKTVNNPALAVLVAPAFVLPIAAFLAAPMPEAENDTDKIGPADREVVITRVFDAARALVFKAWTDPRRS